ncbi:hypothetical protein [Mesorhizobium sp. KR9-304]|uniref:hypothetical protein n=1 Tax=Mesorhizobium sp. KR9-304 TaxID=3156614 RepID=UPI0032B58568
MVKDYLDEGRSVYRAIGHIVSTWATIETEVFRLFKILVHDVDGVPELYFFILRNFSDQLKLTNELFEIRSRCVEERPYWKVLHSYILWLSSHRNFVAHTPVYLEVRQTVEMDDWVFAIQQVPLESPYKPPKPPKDLADLSALSDALDALHQHLFRFNNHLDGTSPSPDKFRAALHDPTLEKYNPGLNGPKKQQGPSQSSLA